MNKKNMRKSKKKLCRGGVKSAQIYIYIFITHNVLSVSNADVEKVDEDDFLCHSKKRRLYLAIAQSYYTCIYSTIMCFGWKTGCYIYKFIRILNIHAYTYGRVRVIRFIGVRGKQKVVPSPRKLPAIHYISKRNTRGNTIATSARTRTLFYTFLRHVSISRGSDVCENFPHKSKHAEIEFILIYIYI